MESGRDERKGTCVLTSLAQKWGGLYMLLPLPKREEVFAQKMGQFLTTVGELLTLLAVD